MFVKGDILLPSRRVARRDWLYGLHHPAVVWDDFHSNKGDFHGIMLTHAKPSIQFKNILMAANHFEAGYEIVFSDTHFVTQVFVKFNDWGPFELVGKLTSEGIAFMKSQIQPNSPPLEFLVYRNATARVTKNGQF